MLYYGIGWQEMVWVELVMNVSMFPVKDRKQSKMYNSRGQGKECRILSLLAVIIKSRGRNWILSW